MEGKHFIFIVFTGLCFLPACFPRIYILVKEALTWDEAQSYCRSKYTDLATAENQEELDKMAIAAQEFYNGHIWIGLHYDVNNWKWSQENTNYYGAAETEFRMWGSGEPSDLGEKENCVEMWEDGSWNDKGCSYKKPFVCSNGAMASPSFIFVNLPKTWSEAQTYCREHYTDLATVRNQSENEQIKTIIQNQQSWIGLQRKPWKWSDGSPVSFIKWNTYEPNGLFRTPCVILHQAQWSDWECQYQFYFVCQLVPVKQRMMRIQINGSSGGLDDTAEVILQQIGQRLKELGMNEDMKLTWRKQPDGKIFSSTEKKKNPEENYTPA